MENSSYILTKLYERVEELEKHLALNKEAIEKNSSMILELADDFAQFIKALSEVTEILKKHVEAEK